MAICTFTKIKIYFSHLTKMFSHVFALSIFCIFLSSCTDVIPEITSLSGKDNAPESFLILDGALATNTLTPNLKIYSSKASEMYITNNPDCSTEGTWLPYSHSHSGWTLKSPNALNTVYIKFKYFNSKESECLSDDILHDDIPPSMSITTTTSDPTPLSAVPITVTLSEPIEGYNHSNLQLTGGYFENLIQNNLIYSFDWVLQNQLNTTHSISLPAGALKDLAGNTSAFTQFDLGFIGGVTSLNDSYSGFESSSYGDWTNASGDNNDWTLISNGSPTPSQNTGPSSAFKGYGYIYTEASVSNNMTIFLKNTSPFNANERLSIHFNYHMYGTDTGSLAFEVSNNGGSIWTPLWSKFGDQGNTWLSQTIDICQAGYSSGTLDFKFIGQTGSGFTSDIALDNIIIDRNGPCGEETPALTPLTDITNSRFYQTHFAQTTVTGLTGTVTANINAPPASNALLRNVTQNSPWSPNGVKFSNNDVLEIQMKAAGFFDQIHQAEIDIGSQKIFWKVETANVSLLTDVIGFTPGQIYTTTLLVNGPDVPITAEVTGDVSVLIRNQTTNSPWSTSTIINHGEVIDLQMLAPSASHMEKEALLRITKISESELRHWKIRPLPGQLKVWGANPIGLQMQTQFKYPNINSEVLGAEDFVQIFSGQNHTCGLTGAGSAYCWGYNFYGQLGDATVTNRSLPTPVFGGLLFTQLSLGNSHTCGRTSSGDIYCWGLNSSGQLGNSTNSNSNTPILVSGGDSWIDLDLGALHSCGVTTSNDAKCWGSNLNGQLGDGTIVSKSVPTLASGLSGNTFKITAGNSHSCAIATSGLGYCWGNNGTGRLGDGTDTSRLNPINFNNDLNWQSIDAGLNHTCGIDTSNQLFCWGSNIYGQLGDNTITQKLSPTPVFGADSWVSVKTGQFSSCGLLSSGELKCWGRNDYGELGTKDFQNKDIPSLVQGALKFTQLSIGESYSCAISISGKDYCWGQSQFSKLGIGEAVFDKTNITLSQPGQRIIASTSSRGPVCALLSDNSAECWGENNYGQLGNGTPSPFESSFQQLTPSLKWKSLTLSNLHSCGLTPFGKAYCWGYNYYGQLGLGFEGSGSQQYTPQEIYGNKKWVKISSHSAHTCGIDFNLDAYCWGYNNNGQLGDGSSGVGSEKSIPTLVSGGYKFKSIATGINHSCGLTLNDKIYCWGYNFHGQLGDATNIQKNIPILVSGGISWRALSANQYSTCGITNSNDLYCWGANFGNAPILIPSSSGWADISVGNGHLCGITTSGSAYCWGNGLSGETGNRSGSIKFLNSPTVIPGTESWFSLTPGSEITFGLFNP